MKSILLSVISFLLVMNVCGKNDVDMRTYLKKVLGNLGKIESASYHENLSPGNPAIPLPLPIFIVLLKNTPILLIQPSARAMCVLTPRIRRDLNLVMMET